MKHHFLLGELPDGSFILLSPDGKESLAARTDWRDMSDCMRQRIRPPDDHNQLLNDGAPPTGGFPRVVAGNDVEADAEPTKRKGWIR
jgi:hypothetical protein